MITPEWLVDNSIGFALNLEKINLIQVIEEQVVRNQKRVSQFKVQFVFENGTDFVPDVYFETKEDAIKEVSSIIDELSKHYKDLNSEVIANGMFRHDILLNNAIVKAKQIQKEKKEGKTETVPTENTPTQSVNNPSGEVN